MLIVLLLMRIVTINLFRTLTYLVKVVKFSFSVLPVVFIPVNKDYHYLLTQILTNTVVDVSMRP